MIFTLQDLIFFHHCSQLIFELLKLSNPLFVNYWAINIDRYFNLYWHLDLDFLLHLHRSIHIHRLLHKYRLIDYNGVFVDWLLDEHLLFDDLWHFYLLYDYLWNFLLDFDVLRYLNYLFNNSFRSWNVLRYFCFDFYWLLYNNLLNHILRHNFIIHSCFFS